MTRAASTSGRISGDRDRIADPQGGPGTCDVPGLDPGELREFLAADRAGVPADPVFKERLRGKLWSMIRRGRSAEPPVGV